MIRAHGITKKYDTHTILDGIDFVAERKKITYILGTSGGGKSTFLKILIGALKPDAGRVFFEDQDITKLSGRELDPFRKKTG
ncbi:MAG: ATP-binding cassette domain-containing protein, partial [Nitrospirota bacterium]